MDPIAHKLQHRSEETLTSAQQSGHEQTRQSFEQVEDLLRFDLAQTPVPAAVAERLQASLAAHPPAPKRWWKRLLGQ